MSNSITLAGIGNIHTDAEGRYSLNDFHKINDLIEDHIDSPSYKLFLTLVDHPALIGFPAIACAIQSFALNTAQTENDKSVSNLYVIESKALGAVKIGKTMGKASTRVKSIRCGCPDATVAKEFHGLGFLEKEIHKRLAEFSVGGEWFCVTPEFAEDTINLASK